MAKIQVWTLCFPPCFLCVAMIGCWENRRVGLISIIKFVSAIFSMVTVIRNGLEEFKASYNPSKFQLYFISSEGITNSSVLVESISENSSEIFPALVMYPGVPLFSVSLLKEGGTGARSHQLPEMSSCRGRHCLVCVYTMAMHAQFPSFLPVSPLSQSPPSPTETPSGPHLGLLF